MEWYRNLESDLPHTLPHPATPDVTTLPSSTPIYSKNPTSDDEWIFWDNLTRGHITLNCMDIASLSVVMTGTAKEAWELIQTEWGRIINMQQSHAQEALNKTV